FREVRIGRMPPQNCDNMIAADIVLAVVDAARWIDADRKFAPVTPANIWFARELGRIFKQSFRSFGHLAHGPAADDPAIGVELVMDALIMAAQDISRDAFRRRGETARV